MADNKEIVELKDKDLEKVSGGATEFLGLSFTGHVGQHDAVKGEKYFIVSDVVFHDWFAGKCTKTWEEDFLVFWSKRKHKMEVIYPGTTNYCIGEEWSMLGEENTLFKYMNGRTVQQCEALGKWD